MPIFDASGLAGDLSGWRAEMGARIQDILARKRIPVTAKLGAMVRKIESAVSTATLKAALSDLMAYFRRETPAAATLVDAELEAYFSSIRAQGRRESIENYGAYIVTVDIRL